MNTIEAIKSRCSVRKFTKEPVSNEALAELIQCAACAPSGSNKQPLSFYIIASHTKIQALSILNPNSKFLSGAPVVVAITADTSVARTPVEDGCAATENFLLAAHALGLGACWVRGHGDVKQNCMEAMLGIKPPLKLISLVAVGHPESCHTEQRVTAPRVEIVN